MTHFCHCLQEMAWGFSHYFLCGKIGVFTGICQVVFLIFVVIRALRLLTVEQYLGQGSRFGCFLVVSRVRDTLFL